MLHKVKKILSGVTTAVFFVSFSSQVGFADSTLDGDGREHIGAGVHASPAKSFKSQEIKSILEEYQENKANQLNTLRDQLNQYQSPLTAQLNNLVSEPQVTVEAPRIASVVSPVLEVAPVQIVTVEPDRPHPVVIHPKEEIRDIVKKPEIQKPQAGNLVDLTKPVDPHKVIEDLSQGKGHLEDPIRELPSGLSHVNPAPRFSSDEGSEGNAFQQFVVDTVEEAHKHHAESPGLGSSEGASIELSNEISESKVSSDKDESSFVGTSAKDGYVSDQTEKSTFELSEKGETEPDKKRDIEEFKSELASAAKQAIPAVVSLSAPELKTLVEFQNQTEALAYCSQNPSSSACADLFAATDGNQKSSSNYKSGPAAESSDGSKTNSTQFVRNVSAFQTLGMTASMMAAQEEGDGEGSKKSTGEDGSAFSENLKGDDVLPDEGDELNVDGEPEAPPRLEVPLGHPEFYLPWRTAYVGDAKFVKVDDPAIPLTPEEDVPVLRARVAPEETLGSVMKDVSGQTSTPAQVAMAQESVFSSPLLELFPRTQSSDKPLDAETLPREIHVAQYTSQSLNSGNAGWSAHRWLFEFFMSYPYFDWQWMGWLLNEENRLLRASGTQD